jgi:hypothetical protein
MALSRFDGVSIIISGRSEIGKLCLADWQTDYSGDMFHENAVTLDFRERIVIRQSRVVVFQRMAGMQLIRVSMLFWIKSGSACSTDVAGPWPFGC